MNTKLENKRILVTNWWPVSDDEWERLNFPEKFNNPVDKEEEKK